MEERDRDLCLIKEKFRTVAEPFCQYHFCTMHWDQNCVCTFVMFKRKGKLGYFPKGFEFSKYILYMAYAKELLAFENTSSTSSQNLPEALSKLL